MFSRSVIVSTRNLNVASQNAYSCRIRTPSNAVLPSGLCGRASPAGQCAKVAPSLGLGWQSPDRPTD